MPHAHKVTNYGEIVKDQDWSPHYVYIYDEQDGKFFIFNLDDPENTILNPDRTLLHYNRFIDTSSSLDIVGYKHSFTNLPGSENPSFSVKIFSSQSPNAQESEWQQIAFVQSENNILFLNNVKRYIKFEITFNSSSSLSLANFLFLVQVNISDISVPVITDHARNVLSKFPSWTKIYSDSLEKATPSVALPESNAGKIVNALLGEDLDNVDRLISDIDFNSYISTADINQVAWVYSVPSVRPGFIKVVGDGIELGRVSSYYDLLNIGFNDYAFFYDFVTQELFTIRPFTTLLIDSVSHNQIEVQNYNTFDELGLKVGLQRLKGESNLNYKKRILDVYQNPPSVSIDGLKRTLRRELDIWRAYGATPDSNYLGATPEVVEISNLEKYGDLYFDLEGNPKKSFFDFVEKMNVRFPSNLGYAKWGEAYWDYAGEKQEGVSSIPQTADVNNISLENYQAGIGDFDDAKIILEKIDNEIKEYNFNLRIKGIRSSSKDQAYEPINVSYDTYLSYYEPYVDNEYATVNYELYLKLKAHGNLTSGSVYKTTIKDIVRNNYKQNSSASPEYIVRSIFNSSEFVEPSIQFVNATGTPYYNVVQPSATESYVLNSIPLYAVDQATINFVSSTNSIGTTGDYAWIQYADATPSTLATNSNKLIIKSATPNSPDQMRLKISSKIWNGEKVKISETQKVRSSTFGNTLNSSTKFSELNNIIIKPESIIKNFLLPHGAVPIYVHIDNVVSSPFDVNLTDSQNPNFGGVSLNREENVSYLIPSSPNIIASFVEVPGGFSTPNLHEDFINMVGSTANYYFTSLKFPYFATPSSVLISSANSQHYPFMYNKWDYFESDHIGNLSFFLSEDGVVKSSPDIDYSKTSSKKTDVVGIYSFNRSDFGLEEYDSSNDLIVKEIEVVNENDEVTIWQENQYDALGNINYNFYDTQQEKFIIKDINIKAKYNKTAEETISPSIRSGWYYQNGQEGFIYARGKKGYFSGQSELNLQTIARNGSPVIVEVNKAGSTPVYYRQVAFYDEATPSIYSYHNFEYIKAEVQDKLFLAYYDVFDVSIIDTFTGQTIAFGLESNTNEISSSLISGNNLFIVGREYRVSYRVRNSFNIDHSFYDQISDEYKTVVRLLSTPNSNFSATVNYETAVYDKDYELPEIKLNPLYSTLDEGYLYLSHNTYQSETVDAVISPKTLITDGVDYLVLNLFSKDINGNPKPNQTFYVSGSFIQPTPSYATTNVDGFARVKVLYSGSQTPIPEQSYIYVNGLNYPSPNSHPNSSSGLASATVNYYLQPVLQSPAKLSAQSDKSIITADGLEKLNITGLTEPNKKIYWRKSRNLKTLLEMNYSTNEAIPGKLNTSGMVTSNQVGQFQIGPFISQNDATPGYWFVTIESENASTPNSSPVTILGDIVYWYEKYDASQNSSTDPLYVPTANESSEYESYFEDSVFKINSITGDLFYDSSASTPWFLPKWYPINRFVQYQLGFFGTTPNQISTFEKLRPDYEEE